MTNPNLEVRRLQEAATQPNFRLPPNCLKGLRLPFNIQYVSNQTLVFEFHKTEYSFDRKKDGDKRLTIYVGSDGAPKIANIVTLSDLLENYLISSGVIDLSTGDIIVTGNKRHA